MADSKRTTVITYRGTVREFRAFLDTWLACQPTATAEEEWELTACIARHPAGKGLRPADPPPCACPPHEYAVAGHRASCPLGGAG